MRRVLTCIAAMIISWLIFLSCAEAVSLWRLDGMNNSELPRNFRLMTNMSGSGQPNPKELYTLYNKLREHADAKIYLIDLRQEPHGFANGYPVSWYVDKNLANYRNDADESERLNNLRGKSVKFVPLGNFDTAHYKPIKLKVTDVKTERQVATAAGFEYIRFGATDMMFPAPKVVDDFCNFLDAVDKDAWLHFHCQAGHGRTTTFMVMRDIITTPNDSLENIVARHATISGVDLLADNNDRAVMLRRFYEYAQDRYSGKVTESWSEFLSKENRN